MKKITFVTGAMSRGGAERVISLLSNYYASLGWNVQIVMLLHSDVEYVLDPAIEVIDISNDRVNAVLDMPRLIQKLRELVKQQQPNVVVAFMAQICLIAGLACRGLKTRLVLSERNDPAAISKGKLFDALRNNVYQKSSLTVMQTERARGYFPKAVQDNSVIIPNPICVKCEASESKRRRIVTAGRLMPQKNQKMLIDAFSTIHKTHPEYVLDIYGEGSLRETLQQRIDDLGLTDAVALKGNVLNIHEEIADAELFVLPSDFEGLSNALLEAMMMGLPCIATNCAGCDEVIRSGENGILIPVGDQRALEKAMEKLITDSALAAQLGKTAKEDSAQFAVDAVIKKWREAIEG